MKFEFDMSIKAVPTADVHLVIECDAEELSIILSDPVYQSLGEKLIREVSFKSGSQRNNNHTDHKANHAQPNDRVEYLRRVVETEHKCQQKYNENLRRQMEVMQHGMQILEKRIEAFKKHNPGF